MRWPPPRTAASTSLSREPHPPGRYRLTLQAPTARADVMAITKWSIVGFTDEEMDSLTALASALPPDSPNKPS